MSKTLTKSMALVLVIIMMALGSTALAAPAVQEQQDIVEVAIADGRFTTLVTALEAADLVETLQGEGPFTVFAPTDEAFAALPDGALEGLLADPAALQEVLLYHVVPGQVMAADVVSLSSADTALGQPLNISAENGTVNINDARVIITDIPASNGVIHVIDTVLLPPTDETMMAEEGAMAESSPMASSCAEDYIVQADDWLSKIAGKFYGDVLAFPAIVDATNAAAQAGGNYASITNPDVIEVGQVLCIPGQDSGSTMSEEPMAAEEQAMAEDEMMANTIVEVAIADGRFTTLVTALEAADLVETLQGEGPFTVFAPTDEAFAALPDGALEGLLADPAALQEVLLYHVVPGQVMAADVVSLSSADTALGQPLNISAENGTVNINDARVIITDIPASNGVIHVIDTVLLPPAQ